MQSAWNVLRQRENLGETKNETEMQSAWNVLRQSYPFTAALPMPDDAIRMERAEAKNRVLSIHQPSLDAIRMERAEAKIIRTALAII